MTIEIQRGKVLTVDRRTATGYAGQGLLKGLGVIWRHWVASFGKNDSYRKIQGTFTIEYPEERRQLPEAFRNMPILLYDDATGHELCTSCFQCQRICPPQVIHMTQEKDPTTGKPVPAVAEFIIEYDACMSCGFCAEVCPFDAIKMDHEFELSTADHPALTVDKRGLNRPISYYERLAPTLWAEAKDGAAKKLAGNIRRRSGAIGIAPNTVGSRQLAVGSQPSAGTNVVGAKQAAQPSPPITPNPALPPASPAMNAPNTPNAPTADDKAARLAAIRAANVAKQAAAGVDAAAPAPETPPVSTDKAARLAAIRAANAAKQAAAGESVEVVAAQRAAPTPDAPISPPTPSTPVDDKAARLAAIRAANAAKKADAGADVAPETPPSPPAAPVDDKAARLAAIRAANAAKQAAAVVNVAAPASETPPAAPVDDKAARLAAIRAANAAKKAAADQSNGNDDA